MEAPLGTVTLSFVVKVVAPSVYEATVTPESTPLTKTFIPVSIVTGAPALLGAAVKETAFKVEAALVKVDATGDVFTRNTESLLSVTLVVPNVFGDDEVLGV